MAAFHRPERYPPSECSRCLDRLVRTDRPLTTQSRHAWATFAAMNDRAAKPGIERHVAGNKLHLFFALN
jgi:hypothetical protein